MTGEIVNDRICVDDRRSEDALEKKGRLDYLVLLRAFVKVKAQ